MDIDKIVQERYNIVKVADLRVINRTNLKREHFKRCFLFAKDNIKNILDSLSDDERMMIFENYCCNCGNKSKKCNCNKY